MEELLKDTCEQLIAKQTQFLIGPLLKFFNDVIFFHCPTFKGMFKLNCNCITIITKQLTAEQEKSAGAPFGDSELLQTSLKRRDDILSILLAFNLPAPESGQLINYSSQNVGIVLKISSMREECSIYLNNPLTVSSSFKRSLCISRFLDPT